MATDSDDGPEFEEGREAGSDGGLGDDPSSDERNWAALAHVSGFAGLFVPFGNVLGPLLVWLLKREESGFVDDSGREALNFQLTWTVLLLLAIGSVFVGVGLLLVPVLALAWVILIVLATVRASEGEVYDYPLTVDLVS